MKLLLLLFTYCSFAALYPDLPPFKYRTLLTAEDNYDFTFSWNLIDNSQAIEGLLNLKSNVRMENPWFAVGFGSTMLSTESIMCHSDYNSTDKFDTTYTTEHKPTGKYSVPVSE
ncbi:hypothetical protein BC833DRAFT_639963 [Globomyces pollinis-pini]|nr:hypothetical protein BC833DRAFT_639963 [Globomyces pollinis-pini]